MVSRRPFGAVMYKITLRFLITLIAGFWTQDAFAQTSAYDLFVKQTEKTISQLKKNTARQELNKIKTQLNSEITKYQKLVDEGSEKQDSEKQEFEKLDSEKNINSKVLEQFHFFNLTFEPTFALYEAKKQNKQSCVTAKNRTEIDNGLGQGMSPKLSLEAKLAFAAIRILCP